jgi:translation initiation factor RLI1
MNDIFDAKYDLMLGYLVFIDNDNNCGFEIKSTYLNEKEREKIFNYFKNYDDENKELIKEYLEMRKIEKQLNKKRKEMLKKIKEKYNDDEFREKIINDLPELFI